MDREAVREGIRQAIRNGTPPEKIASAIKNGRLSVIGFDDTPAYKAKDVQLRDAHSKNTRERDLLRQDVDDHESSALSKIGNAPGGGLLRTVGEYAEAVPGALKAVDKGIYKGAGKAYTALDSMLPGGGEYDPAQVDADLERKYKNLAERPLEAVAQVANRTVNSATLGGYNAAMDPLAEFTGMPLVPSRESRASFSQDHPIMSSAADAVGGAAGAPRVLASKVAGLPTLQGLGAQGRLGRVAAEGIGGAATGGISAGTMATMDGADPGDAAVALGKGMLLGGALGAGAAGAGQAAGAFKEKLRGHDPRKFDPNTPKGRRPADKSRVYQEARESGIYDDPPDEIWQPERVVNGKTIPGKIVKAPVGENGQKFSTGGNKNLRADHDYEIYDISDEGRQKIGGSLESRHGEASREFGLAKAKTLATTPDLQADEILGPIRRLQTENTGSKGQILDGDVDRALGEVRRIIYPDESGPTISTADLLKGREVIKNRADFDGPSTAENRPWRVLHRELGDMLPDSMRKANAKLGVEKDAAKRVGELLSAGEGDVLSSKASKELAANAVINRSGEGTVPEYVRTKHLRELAELDPLAAEAVLDQNRARAHLATRFKVPVEKTMGGFTGVLGDNARFLNRGADAVTRTAEGALNTTARLGPATLGADIMGEDADAALQERARRRKARK